MKAIAVAPGKPNSIHLREVPKPDLKQAGDWDKDDKHHQRDEREDTPRAGAGHRRRVGRVGRVAWF